MTSNTTNDTGDDNKEYVYVVLTAIMAGLSIFGGTSICILYIVFKDLRTSGRQLLFYLAFSDALLAFGNLLGIIWFLYEDSPIIHRSEIYCDFQSAMTIYFSMASFSWTVIMGTSLFSTVVLNNQNFTSNYMRWFHIIAWIPGGIITVIAWSLGVLGTDTTLDQASWCWIDPRVPNTLLWQFVTGKFLEIVCYIATVVLYSSIKIFLARQSKKMIGKAKKKSKRDVIAEANRKLTFVPLVFIVCRIWGTLRFMIGNFANDIVDEPYVTWINPLQGIGDSAQGFANFVIYCFSTESIRRRMIICHKNKIHVAETSGFESKTRDSKLTGQSAFPSTNDTTNVHTTNNDKNTFSGKSDTTSTLVTPITTKPETNQTQYGEHSTVVNVEATTRNMFKYSYNLEKDVTATGNVEMADNTSNDAVVNDVTDVDENKQTKHIESRSSDIAGHIGNTNDDLKTENVTIDAGGVYLGTDETDPTKNCDVVVKITPPLMAECDKNCTDIGSEKHEVNPTDNVTNTSRRLSVAIDIHNTSSTDNQGLAGVSN